jgi:hypothetical protein
MTIFLLFFFFHIFFAAACHFINISIKQKSHKTTYVLSALRFIFDFQILLLLINQVPEETVFEIQKKNTLTIIDNSTSILDLKSKQKKCQGFSTFSKKMLLLTGRCKPISSILISISRHYRFYRKAVNISQSCW